MEVSTVAFAFRLSAQAKDKMIERGISRQEATEATMKGAKRQNGSRILAHLLGIEVVFVQRSCDHFVIMLSRR